MTDKLLGVFCPFWSDEGPHFILPHFQGMMKTLGADASVLDLNIEAAEALKSEWGGLSGNSDGIWSNPESIIDRLQAAGIPDILKKALADQQPSWAVLLGVNVASYHVARYLMREIRAAFSGNGVRVAVGGPVCFDFENPIEAFPEADLVWQGTLETALPYLIGRPDTEASQGSSILRFQPDFTGIDMTRYSQPERLPYLLNYGCRFRCRFCHEGAQYRREISRQTAGLADELKALLLSLPSVRYIRFNDSSLNSHHGQFLSLLDELSRENLYWGCNLTPTRLIDGDVARLMAISGCLGVNIGVESGSRAVRHLMGKPTRISDVKSCIKALHSAGLDVSINLMAGYPGEGKKDVDHTLHLIDRLSPFLSDILVGKAAIYVGTPLFKQATSLGIQLNGDIRREFVFNHWALADGSNTPTIREDRLRRIELHLANLGFKNARSPDANDIGQRALKRIDACAG